MAPSERICPASKSHPFWLTLAGGDLASSSTRPRLRLQSLKYPHTGAGSFKIGGFEPLPRRPFMPRMNILNTVEREAFNSPPVFSSFQRKQYFDFPSKLRRFAAGLRNPAYQLGFLLSTGYFKAARRFFSPGLFPPAGISSMWRASWS